MDLLEKSRGRLQIWEQTPDYQEKVIKERVRILKQDPFRYSLLGWQVYRGRGWEVLGTPSKIEFEPVKPLELGHFRALFTFAHAVSRDHILNSERLLLAASNEGILEYASPQAPLLSPSSLSFENYGHFAPDQYTTFILHATNISLDQQQGVYLRVLPYRSPSETAFTETIWPRSLSKQTLHQLEAKLISEVNDHLCMVT